MDELSNQRVVLVHDWLTGMRGGEKCLEMLCRHFPKARLFNLLHKPGSVSAAIERLNPQSSFLQFLPRIHRYYRYLLPLMPLAARWRLPACDLVISLSHCVAKSALAPEGAPHVCYCLTPMRYAWHLREAYFGPRGGLPGRLAEPFLHWLRAWDRKTARRVNHFVAISRTVQQRIADCYGRESRIIYPPVDTDFFCPAAVPRAAHYLVLSALVPYKRVDLAISACNRLRRELLVIGSGSEEKKLRSLAGPTVHFLGWQPAAAVRDHLRRCRALLFPGEEDFGIVPLEAQACGTPVLAFGRGGATETVIPVGAGSVAHIPGSCFCQPTGMWFEEQTADCLADAIVEMEKWQDDFSPQAAREQALRFNPRRFEEEMFGYLSGVLNKKNAGNHTVAGAPVPVTADW